MWLIVLYDLPVVTKAERKAATRFHKHLLDQGFEMAQFSVYMRLCAGKEQAMTYVRRIENNAPRSGRVNILTITDKQYENMICFRAGNREGQRKNPEQLVLF
ncbi:MAG: CRISPR-associated endonuclease Cas2 [Magnetococcales bacterium]|nr:CRISPR-associated endonuclease Cas2 [Magnetococcales bacterium]